MKRRLKKMDLTGANIKHEPNEECEFETLSEIIQQTITGQLEVNRRDVVEIKEEPSINIEEEEEELLQHNEHPVVKIENDRQFAVQVLPRQEMSKLYLITEQIKSGKLRIAPKQKVRSAVWKVFGIILNEMDEVVKDVVACRECMATYNWISNSTTNLQRHRCYSKVKPSEDNTVFINKNDKKRILDATVKLCVEDCRPYSIVDGVGMIEFTRACVNIGVKYASSFVNIEDMLPNSEMVYNGVAEMFNKLTPIVSVVLRGVGNFAAATHLWTDKNINQSYLSLTVQYLNDDVLYQRVLAVRKMNESTGRNVKETIEDIFNSYGIKDLDSVMFVTDRERILTAAVTNRKRYSCMDDILQAVLTKATNDVPELLDLFESGEKLIEHLTKTNQLNRLNRTVNSIRNKWGFKLNTLTCIKENWQVIKVLLNENDEFHRLKNINLKFLTEVIKLLELFQKAFIELRKSTCTTYLVYPYFNSLTKSCTDPTGYDSEVMIRLKNRVNYYLVTIMLPEIDIIYKTATFLYPPCKQMQLLSETEKTEIYDYLKTLTGSKKLTVPTEPIISNPNDLFSDFASPSNQPNPLFNDFSMMTTVDPVSKEIGQYLLLPITDSNVNILEWWCEYKHLFKHLYKAHTIVNSLPATIQAAQTAISTARSVFNEDRMGMNCETVDHLIVANSNLKINNVSVYGNQDLNIDVMEHE